ncbi:MAG TPA: non-canonical purine NTP pyrophosphatase [Chloroflexota bacterium]|nr:non-canonical purine NTP pyrophosphatase [Chloroflexota bacterium]
MSGSSADSEVAKAPPIVLGTNNPAKRAKLRWLLTGLPFRALEAPPLSVPETGATFRDNAAAKALAHSAAGWAIASDGGLVIPALRDRWQPLRTAEQGPELLAQLLASRPDRTVAGWWHEALAIACRGTLRATFEAEETHGLLQRTAPGSASGFWVDQLLWIPEAGTTLAQASQEQRTSIDRTWNRLRRELRAHFGV